MVYHGIGNYCLVSGNSFYPIKNRIGGYDLRLRWLETQYILRGYTKKANTGHDVTFTPQDKRELVQNNGDPLKLTKSDGTIAAIVRTPSIGGYPPWAFLATMVLLSGDWPTSRVVFAVLNLLATLVVVRWVWNLGWRYGRDAAWLSVSATLAFGAFLNILVMGQLGTIVLATLIGAWWAYERNQHTLSGFLLGLAMIKPTIAFTFVLLYVVNKAWRPLTIMLVYILVATGIVYAATQSPPLEMFRAMAEAGAYSLDRTPGIGTIAADTGLGPRWSLGLLGVTGVFIAWFLIHSYREYDISIHFVIAAVIGRVFAYHRPVDNIMLIFLTTLLVVIAVSRDNTVMRIMFVLVGVSLWLPTRANWFFPGSIQLVIWSVAFIALLVCVRHWGATQMSRTN